MSTTPELIAKLEQLGDEFLAQAQSLEDEQSIRAAQAQFLGKKGKVSELMKELGKLPASDRPQVGAAANKVKEKIEQMTEACLSRLTNAAKQADLARRVDVTLPARPVGGGHLHLLTQVRQEAVSVFAERAMSQRTSIPSPCAASATRDIIADARAPYFLPSASASGRGVAGASASSWNGRKTTSTRSASGNAASARAKRRSPM